MTPTFANWDHKLVVNVDQNSGHFVVEVDDVNWFESGPVSMIAHEEKYTTSDGTLQLSFVATSEGSDSMGEYLQTSLSYKTVGGEEMIADIFQYSQSVVFQQSFPEFISGTSSGDADGVITKFPSFVIKACNFPFSVAVYV